MSTVTMPESKSAVARELAAHHYALEPGMQSIFRMLKAEESEQDWDEPLKLLEVNADTVEGGIVPLHFGSRTENGQWYPPVILIVVTPAEFKRLREGGLKLPHDWTLGQEWPRETP